MTKPNKWDKQHLRNLGLTQKQIDKIFDTAAKEAAAIGASLHNFNPDRPFSFADYPQTKARIEKLIKNLRNKMITAIVNSIRSEWTLANNKNSALCDLVFGDNKSRLPKEQLRKYYSNNSKALEAFIQRKNAGLNLSDRVWNYSSQFKTEIELGIDLDLRTGTSAAEMARNLKQYLNAPDKLFRRVRDEHGQLHLSKNAKAYNPGAGVYRSSYKNALRLARTETNMAYRTSDYTRWQQLDFVVGIEIRLSNNHPVADICDDLKGKYPKDFKFTGWHPQCRCHAISILKTEAEIASDNQRIMNGEEPDITSVNTIRDTPENFKKWVADNGDRIEKANNRGTLPYFLKDNANFAGIKVKEMYSANKERIKELRSWAKEHLQQKSLRHEGFGREIHFTGTGIREYLNQPHKYFSQKNELIKEMDSVLKDSIYKGVTSYHKGNANIVASHIFEININGEKSWIIVREGTNGDTNFYSISDSSKVLQGIKK